MYNDLISFSFNRRNEGIFTGYYHSFEGTPGSDNKGFVTEI